MCDSVHGGGHALQGVRAWWGACMAGGYVWRGVCGGGGACLAGEMAIAAGGTHPTGMHSCFSLQSQSVHLCSTILDVISSIYHQDNANYFILETQCTLSQFAERIHMKHLEIQVLV